MFFDKPASELTLREAALLAGLPQAPSQYNPFLNAGRRARRAATRCCSGWPTRATSSRRRPTRTKRMRRSASSATDYYTHRREGYFFDYVKQELIEHYGARHRRAAAA